LTRLDEQEIIILEGLDTLLETRYKVGDTVSIMFLRVGEEKTVTVTLVEEPAN
jgi:S1-C subfamily serine protease